jgi:hypothetical protein
VSGLGACHNIDLHYFASQLLFHVLKVLCFLLLAMARGRRFGIPPLKTATGSPHICKKSLTLFAHHDSQEEKKEILTKVLNDFNSSNHFYSKPLADTN